MRIADSGNHIPIPSSINLNRFAQIDPKATAFAGLRGQTDGPSHPLDGFLHNGKSDPGARITSGLRQSFEYPEDPFLVLRPDADPIVPEAKPDPGGMVFRPNADLRRHTARDEFQRVTH